MPEVTSGNLATDIFIVGNYCHDTLVLPTGTFEALGGSASYISAALLGFHGIRYNVIAHVGPDFLYRDRVAVPPHVIPGAATTHFVDDLTRGERCQTLRAICPPIRASDIPDGHARIGLACGVAMEILPETLRRIRQLCGQVICDAQGLLREVTAEGKVSLRPLADTPFVEVLGCIDYLKASEAEAGFLDLDSVQAKTRIIITEGPKGCRILDRQGETVVPSISVEEIDSTGAGDFFVAGFAAALLRGLPVEQAAQEGNRMGAIAVGHVGIPVLPVGSAERSETGQWKWNLCPP